MTATNSPGWMSNVASFHTSLFRYRTSTRSTWIAGGPDRGASPPTSGIPADGEGADRASTRRQCSGRPALTVFARPLSSADIRSRGRVFGVRIPLDPVLAHHGFEPPSAPALSAFARLLYSPYIQSWKLVSGGWMVSLT